MIREPEPYIVPATRVLVLPIRPEIEAPGVLNDDIRIIREA
jgi:hypothetical protein